GSIRGVTPPQAGRVAFKGVDITGWEPYRVARAGIGFVPEDRRIFADLTVWENLDVAQRGNGGFTIEKVFDLFPTLQKLTGRNGGEFFFRGPQEPSNPPTPPCNPPPSPLSRPPAGVRPPVRRPPR